MDCFFSVWPRHGTKLKKTINPRRPIGNTKQENPTNNNAAAACFMAFMAFIAGAGAAGARALEDFIAFMADGMVMN